ncbi:hypothetical protein [Mycobacteroides salmoniphilum]|uniref:hypothetical protein n=1 Tax=Mycobacteroides salmoniphilum TaxID=404941 RepID=UPI0010649CBB|nr:hypothetical protein [Mycobacteroides salmoniphilum]TDZ80438.1 hypothetical protein DE4586_00373 [Mycobacteroides salmoniphilum]TDZ87938.1 hypothetical protein DE4587_00289 [Mycobacteroides salmoniphilum]
MKNRLMGAGVIALAAALGGPALAAAAPADEQQIRQIISGEASAIKSLDNATLSTFFCDKYRGTIASKSAEDQIPPISEVSGYGPGMIGAVASAAGVSGPTTQALTTAIQNNDDKAYRTSFRNAAREVLSGVTYNVSDINVTGPTATAAVTAQGHDVTANQQREFVQENGKWKDCTDPEKRAETSGNPLLTSLLH